MVKGAAVRGISKILRKGLKKAPVLGKYARGTPTKAGLTARRGALRGETLAEKYKGFIQPIPKGVKAPKKPGFKTGVALGAAAALAAKSVDDIMKKAKAEDKKLKKATEEHKKKTKEKRKKYGKHHG